MHGASAAHPTTNGGVAGGATTGQGVGGAGVGTSGVLPPFCAARAPRAPFAATGVATSASAGSCDAVDYRGRGSL